MARPFGRPYRFPLRRDFAWSASRGASSPPSLLNDDGDVAFLSSILESDPASLFSRPTPRPCPRCLFFLLAPSGGDPFRRHSAFSLSPEHMPSLSPPPFFLSLVQERKFFFLLRRRSRNLVPFRKECSFCRSLGRLHSRSSFFSRSTFPIVGRGFFFPHMED